MMVALKENSGWKKSYQMITIIEASWYEISWSDAKMYEIESMSVFKLLH